MAAKSSSAGKISEVREEAAAVKRRGSPVQPVMAAPPPAPSAPPASGAPAAAGNGKLSAEEREAQTALAAAALAEAMATRDLPAFYRVFRAGDLAILPPRYYSRDPRGLHAACFEILRRFGSISPAVGVAIFNHYAVSCTLSTFPLRNNATLASRRKALLASLIAGRTLVANTTSRVHSDKVESYGCVARHEGDGFHISGSAAYMSLATESELVLVFSQLEGEGFAIFMAPLRDNPAIQIGPFLFPNAMVDSDTRSVTFDCHITPENMLRVDRTIAAFQVAWHQALFPAPFLGAAARALEEARKFLRSVRAANDRPLAEADGVVADIGRLAIDYRAACAMVLQAGQAIEAVARRPSLPEFMDAYHLANAAKHFATRVAEEIVTAVRRIIGGRSLAGTHPMERISQEVMFGPLGGEINALIERRLGRLALGENEFLSHRW
ncbi:MAG TPA: acyl-CoA dehydrogenase family protein [Thermoanaerobaculia bacterium]|nr:acyl-CoA dehydrogenase family protein [Thermoanaerobaculia bacterium]